MSSGTRSGGFGRVPTWPAALLLAALVAGCGGSGGGDGPQGSAQCDLDSQKTWLRGYMRDWYYWSGSAPNPEPAGFATLADYFGALKYASYPGYGIEPWSYYQDTASYNQFFAEGRTLGYGLFVNGSERQLPLKVRMTEPLSPAATAGLLRGDTIVSVNGVAAADLIAGNFAVLNPARAGDRITVVADTATGRRSVVLTAIEYELTPVPAARVLDIGDGRRAGYLVLKDFITQAETPLAGALADFRAAGASELILDLRYNGGGRISTANQLASQIVGALHQGKVFATLRYNAAHQGSNRDFTLTTAPAPAFARVVVLTGPRSCSATELLVNGLAPYAQVVTVGDTSCGKPYGFNPQASCDNTFSVVNFRAVNASGEADYDTGIAPDCAQADDFERAFGDPAETLTATALGYLRSGSCPAAASGRAGALAAPAPRARSGLVEPGERRGMSAD
ncbi:S41 family peptidase [Variovorax sp. YR752]|uniref:S41 family peptidase n=1 Tax=Variovorax sp. YR752 TaxID=1884383 RepID=UPI0031380437